jgi:hypothetical protein
VVLNPPDFVWDDDEFWIKVTAKDASGNTDTSYSGNAKITARAGGKTVTLNDHSISSSDWENGVLKEKCRWREIDSNPNSVDAVMDITVTETDTPSCGRTGSAKLTLKVSKKSLQITLPTMINVGATVSMQVKALNADSTVDTTCGSTFDVTEDGVGHLHHEGADLHEIPLTAGAWSGGVSYVSGVGVEQLRVSLSEQEGSLEGYADTRSHQTDPTFVHGSSWYFHKNASRGALTYEGWCSLWEDVVSATPTRQDGESYIQASRQMTNSHGYVSRGYSRFDVQAYGAVSTARLRLWNGYYDSFMQCTCGGVEKTMGFPARLLVYCIDLGGSPSANGYDSGIRGKLVAVLEAPHIAGIKEVHPDWSIALDPSWINNNDHIGFFIANAAEAIGATPPYPGTCENPSYLTYWELSAQFSIRLELET